ncbi:MAG: hypothetical protein AAF965_00075 [Pseudomonadota bacterium]
MAVLIDIYKVAEDPETVAYKYAKSDVTPTKPGLILIDKATFTMTPAITSSSPSDIRDGVDTQAVMYKIKKTMQTSDHWPEKLMYAAG